MNIEKYLRHEARELAIRMTRDPKTRTPNNVESLIVYTLQATEAIKELENTDHRKASHETLVGLLKTRGPFVIKKQELVSIIGPLHNQVIVYSEGIDDISIRLADQTLPREVTYEQGIQSILTRFRESEVDGDGDQ